MPRLCIRITGMATDAAKGASSSSSSSAEISFRMSAPASNAAFITFFLRVSTETGIELRLRTASITGIIRLSSSSSETYSLPGREDSPPISRMSAPSSIRRSAFSAPPRLSFQKESGVAFTTPITNAGREVSITLSARNSFFIFLICPQPLSANRQDSFLPVRKSGYVIPD